MIRRADLIAAHPDHGGTTETLIAALQAYRAEVSCRHCGRRFQPYRQSRGTSTRYCSQHCARLDRPQRPRRLAVALGVLLGVGSASAQTVSVRFDQASVDVPTVTRFEREANGVVVAIGLPPPAGNDALTLVDHTTFADTLPAPSGSLTLRYRACNAVGCGGFSDALALSCSATECTPSGSTPPSLRPPTNLRMGGILWQSVRP